MVDLKKNAVSREAFDGEKIAKKGEPSSAESAPKSSIEIMYEETAL